MCYNEPDCEHECRGCESLLSVIATLKAQLAAEREAVRVLGADARKRAEALFQYSSVAATSYIRFVSDDVLNNPIARAAVEA